MKNSIVIFLTCFLCAALGNYVATVNYFDEGCSNAYQLSLILTGQCVYDALGDSYSSYTCDDESFGVSADCQYSNCTECYSAEGGNLPTCGDTGSLGEGYSRSCPSDVILPPFDYSAASRHSDSNCSGDPSSVIYTKLDTCGASGLGEIMHCNDTFVVITQCSDSACTQDCVMQYEYELETCMTESSGKVIFTCGQGDDSSGYVVMPVVVALLFEVLLVL